MERLLLAAALLLVAGAAAAVVRSRRRVDAPTVPVRHSLPTQLDRRDFPSVERPWLVVLFGSATCAACLDAAREVDALAADDVAIVHVDEKADRELHKRYGIDAVPAIVIADAHGVVQSSSLGPPPAGHLRVVLADLRR